MIIEELHYIAENEYLNIVDTAVIIGENELTRFIHKCHECTN